MLLALYPRRSRYCGTKLRPRCTKPASPELGIAKGSPGPDHPISVKGSSKTRRFLLEEERASNGTESCTVQTGGEERANGALVLLFCKHPLGPSFIRSRARFRASCSYN